MTAVSNFVISRFWDIFIQSSLLIAVVLSLRAVFGRRLDRRFRYYLWLPVLLRLFLPFSVGSRLSVMNLLAPAVHPGAAETVLITDAAIPTNAASADRFPWQAVIICVWIAGVTAVALITLRVNTSFYSDLKKDRKEADVDVITGLCAMMGIKRIPKVYISDNAESPCAVGFFRPAIYLPRWAVSDKERLRYILMHELTHIKYRDNPLSLLISACCAVYWFHPLVWIMASSAIRDRELACDARVTGSMDAGEKTAYGMALVSSVQIYTGRCHRILAPAFAAREHEMVERIEAIKSKRPASKRIAALVCAIMLIALVTAGTSAKAPASDISENGSDSGSSALAYISSSSFKNSTAIFLDTVSVCDQDTVKRLRDSLTPDRSWEPLNTLDPSNLKYYDESLIFYGEYYRSSDEKMIINILNGGDMSSGNVYQVIEKNNEGYVYWPSSNSNCAAGTYMRMSDAAHESFRAVIEQLTSRSTEV